MPTESIYELIGHCVEQDNKRYFEELKEKIGHREALAADLGQMPRIRELFCGLRGIARETLEARNYDRQAARARQLCIALLYRCYCPNALNPRIGGRPPRHFKTRLSQLLNISTKKIGSRSADALFAYGHDRPFRESVEALYEAVARTLENESLPEPTPRTAGEEAPERAHKIPQAPPQKAAQALPAGR